MSGWDAYAAQGIAKGLTAHKRSGALSFYANDGKTFQRYGQASNLVKAADKPLTDASLYVNCNAKHLGEWATALKGSGKPETPQPSLVTEDKGPTKFMFLNNQEGFIAGKKGDMAICIGSSSWQAYADNLTAQGLVKAAVFGPDGGVWAKSANLNLSTQEAVTTAQLFNNPGQAQAAGIQVDGVKYLVIKADARSLYGKKGTGGVVLVKTTQAVVLGIYDDKLQPGKATTVVEKLADSLIENGY
jgi:profilin